MLRTVEACRRPVSTEFTVDFAVGTGTFAHGQTFSFNVQHSIGKFRFGNVAGSHVVIY